MLLETSRLRLRPFLPTDFEALFEVIGDPLTMQFYPAPYDKQGTLDWIERNLRRYEEDGSGLRAVVLKSSDEMIGDGSGRKARVGDWLSHPSRPLGTRLRDGSGARRDGVCI
jgi:RimJ/RimL family protein N-acetyltransferase